MIPASPASLRSRWNSRAHATWAASPDWLGSGDAERGTPNRAKARSQSRWNASRSGKASDIRRSAFGVEGEDLARWRVRLDVEEPQQGGAPEQAVEPGLHRDADPAVDLHAELQTFDHLATRVARGRRGAERRHRVAVVELPHGLGRDGQRRLEDHLDVGQHVLDGLERT